MGGPPLPLVFGCWLLAVAWDPPPKTMAGGSLPHPGPAMLTRRVAEAEQQEKAARMRYTAIVLPDAARPNPPPPGVAGPAVLF